MHDKKVDIKSSSFAETYLNIFTRGFLANISIFLSKTVFIIAPEEKIPKRAIKEIILPKILKEPIEYHWPKRKKIETRNHKEILDEIT